MEKPKLFGLMIHTVDARPYVVANKKFKTEAEALAYKMGVDDAAMVADCEDLFGEVGSWEPEIE